MGWFTVCYDLGEFFSFHPISHFFFKHTSFTHAINVERALKVIRCLAQGHFGAGRLMVRRPKNDVRHLKPLLHVPPTSPVSLRQVEKQELSLINVSKVDLLTALLHKLATHCMSVPDKQVSYIIRGNNEKYAAQWQTRTVVWGEAHICLPSTDQLESDWTPPNHLNLQIWQIEKSLMKLYN